MIEVRRLRGAEARAELDALAAVLVDCVESGASVSYMAPFSHADARAAFEAVAAEVAEDRRVLLAAYDDRELVGTVQVDLATPPNQPHRGDVAKLLVRRSARRRGIAALLMEAAEREAQAEGKTLLVLDTVTGEDAERLYARLGWTRVGVIPDYALYPDGRLCDTTVFYKRLREVQRLRIDDPDDLERTDAQKEWAIWAEHGYAKPYQPRSVLRFGTIFFLLFGIGLVVVFWLAANGRFP